jgi:hypothetical protein
MQIKPFFLHCPLVNVLGLCFLTNGAQCKRVPGRHCYQTDDQSVHGGIVVCAKKRTVGTQSVTALTTLVFRKKSSG